MKRSTSSRALRNWRIYQLSLLIGLGICSLGCNSPMSMLWFLNRGDGKVPAQYKFDSIEGKNEMKVAVIVTCNPSLQMTTPENASLDRELMNNISNVLGTETKGNKIPITVIDSSKIAQVKNAHPALWETGSRGELATKLGADYILEVYINSFILDSQQYGGEITTGRSAYNVAVFRAGTATEPVHTYPDTYNPEFRQTRSINPQHYRIIYVRQLAETIARKHIEHIPERERSLANR